MAKEANPTGVYRPLTWRARRLIAQLRRATHRTVQNAIIQELIHELEKGSRRVRRQAAQWRQQVKKHAGAQIRRQGGRAATALGKRIASTWRAMRHGPRMQCTCGQEFRSRLLFNAHARGHQRETARAPRATINSGMTIARTRQPGPSSRSKGVRVPPAAAHARDVIGAAGPQGRAAQAAARDARKNGPVGAKDLKAMARQWPLMREGPPSRDRPEPQIHPYELVRARSTPLTPAARARARRLAIVRRHFREQARMREQARGAVGPAGQVLRDRAAGHVYDTPAGRITSDRPLTARQRADLAKEVGHAERLQAAGKAGPGDTVRTTRVNGKRVSSKVVPGRPAPGRSARGGK